MALGSTVAPSPFEPRTTTPLCGFSLAEPHALPLSRASSALRRYGWPPPDPQTLRPYAAITRQPSPAEPLCCLISRTSGALSQTPAFLPLRSKARSATRLRVFTSRRDIFRHRALGLQPGSARSKRRDRRQAPHPALCRRRRAGGIRDGAKCRAVQNVMRAGNFRLRFFPSRATHFIPGCRQTCAFPSGSAPRTDLKPHHPLTSAVRTPAWEMEKGLPAPCEPSTVTA